MKRMISLFLCAAMLLSLAPLSAPARAAQTTTSQTAPLRARQYGEQTELVVDQNGLAGRILYPLGDIEPIDTVLTTWASLTLAACEKTAKAADAEKGVKARLSVDYEAYETAKRYVGIEEYGSYQAVGGETTYILYTFNYDLATGKPLALFEVIDESHTDAVIALVQKKLAQAGVTDAGANGLVSKDDLHQFGLVNDGIEWLFITESGIAGVFAAFAELLPYLALTQATPAPTATPAPAADAAPAIEQTAVCTSGGAHVRSGPGTSYALLGSVPLNAQIEVIKSFASDNWHEIWYNNQVAYIASGLVRLTGEKEGETIGWVTSDYVHIRAGAGTEYAVVGTLDYQARVEIIQRDAVGRWHKIWFNNQAAYVYDQYIHIGDHPINPPAPGEETPAPEKIEPDPVSKTSVSVSEIGTSTTDNLVVRQSRTVHADYYGKLSKGQQVYILEYGDTWCKIYVPLSNDNGYIGYAHTKYLEITNPDVTEAENDNPKIIVGR